MLHPMSDRQRSFLESLFNDVYLADGPARAEKFFATMPTSKDASARIDELLAARKAMPRPVHKAAIKPYKIDEVMPEPGYYAVAYEDVLRFYRVKDGTGRWEGRRFINRYRSDYLDRLSRDERSAVLEAILSDPATARMTFARETTRCWRCGRRLTDAESRARGVGSECAALLGMGHVAPKSIPVDAVRAYEDTPLLDM